MSDLLFACPRCAQPGFYLRGLRAHVCRGASRTDERRRLTQRELEAAQEVARTVQRMTAK